jgi:hypothetical protein
VQVSLTSTDEGEEGRGTTPDERGEDVTRSRTVSVLLVVGSLVVGGAVGASLFSPMTSVAATSTGTASSAGGEMTACDGHRGRVGNHLQAAADAIGIDEADLMSALRDGQTVADVAKVNDVPVRDVIDAMVVDAQERLGQAVDDGMLTRRQATEIGTHLEEHITAMVHGDPPAPGHGMGFGRGPGPIAGFDH